LKNEIENMKKVLILLAVLIVSMAHAKKIRLDLDLAEFRYNDTTSLWEMYYVFPDTTLKYINEDGKYVGEMFFNVEIISNETDSIVSGNKWIVSFESDEPIKKFTNDLFGQKDFLVPKGQHTFRLSLRDVNDSSTYAFKEFVIVSRDHSVDDIYLSHIQFAQNIERQTESDGNWSQNFLKNFLYVIPNPRLEFLGDQPVMYTYSEIYNAQKISPKGIKLVYEFCDAMNRPIARIEKEQESFANSIVETMKIPLEALPTGVYILNLKLLHPIDTPIDSIISSKKFYVLNPNNPAILDAMFIESLDFEHSEFATMNKDQIENEYRQIQYIIEEYEKDLYKASETIDAKRKFLFRFWNSRSPDTTMVINPVREEYRDRIRYANKHFSFGIMEEGWRTERGRVYLMYGPPTEIDRKPLNNNQRAYEIWFYAERQGGIHFYFVDVQNIGNYFLVHSTASGEARNENWYNEYVDTDALDPFREKLYDRR
jgi:GWxTD domain-containing protein